MVQFGMVDPIALPSCKPTFCYGKSPFFMGKSTISMAMASIATCECLPEAIPSYIPLNTIKSHRITIESH